MWFLIFFCSTPANTESKDLSCAMPSLLGFDLVPHQLHQALLGSAAYVSSVPSLLWSWNYVVLGPSEKLMSERKTTSLLFSNCRRVIAAQVNPENSNVIIVNRISVE